MDFGIDFGTTNSACVGIQQQKRAVKYTDGYGNPFPSLVIIDRITGKVYCGREAWRNREKYSDSCEVIPSIKTYLGTNKTWKIKGKEWTPEMVAAEVFLGLKKQVVKKGATARLEEAVVAVPVGFPASKRVALRKAAMRAGIKIKSFVSEPTAALFCHYEEIGFHSTIGVIDWGGGTLDIAIVENRKGRVRELATGGLNLGGDHIDRKLAEWAHERIISEKKARISFEEMPPAARDKLIASCEQAKKDLTYDDQVEISIGKYGELGTVRVVLDIDTFSSLIASDVERAIECFEQTLSRAKLSIEELGCILMVGGSVNLRPFSERASQKWHGKVFYPLESDWSVALGAASLSSNPGQYHLAQTIGVTMSDGSLFPLVKEGDPVVPGKSTTFTFALVEDSPTANFIFSDGNGTHLGYMNVPAFGFFREKIEVTAAIDSNLILEVVARSQKRSTGTTQRWNYDKLRFNYQLPATDLEVTADE